MSQFRRRVSLNFGTDWTPETGGAQSGCHRSLRRRDRSAAQRLSPPHRSIGRIRREPPLCRVTAWKAFVKTSPPDSGSHRRTLTPTSTLAGWIDRPLPGNRESHSACRATRVTARDRRPINIDNVTANPQECEQVPSDLCIPVTGCPFSRTSSKSLSSVPPVHEYSSPIERRSFVSVEGIERQRRRRTTQRVATRTGIQLEASTKVGRISPVSRVNGRTRNRQWAPAFSFDLCGDGITRLL